MTYMNVFILVNFKVLTAANIKLTAFWDIALRSLIEVDRRFRGTYRLHRQCYRPED
jgi:hypothetical protein